MADPANSSEQDMENVRKSSRLKQRTKFEETMSMFLPKSRKVEKRSYDSSTEEDEPSAEASSPEKFSKKEVKSAGSKLAARSKETPTKPEPKLVKREVKTTKPVKSTKLEIKPKKTEPKADSKPAKVVAQPSTSTEEDDEAVERLEGNNTPEENDNETSFNLAMLDLRRVGDTAPVPKKDREPIQLNRRGMPQRIRKKNKFFDDHVILSPVNKQRTKKETPVKAKEEKRLFNKGRPREGVKREDLEGRPSLVDEEKENNVVRQKIGMTLRNLLKLPKAQRWVFYEWFYSNIDRVLFFGVNDFTLLLKENFGDLKLTHLRRAEWCVVRRLLGKPRRCSQAFFREERRALERKRCQIRLVQQRNIRDLSVCKEIPDRIPLHLSVNSRVTARLRRPQAGLFTGKVDAVDPSNHTYRITFDRPGLGTHSIPDYEVLLDGEPDMISISTMTKRYLSRTTVPRPLPRPLPPPVATETGRPGLRNSWANNIHAAEFPKSFFEMILRICKILKEKRIKVEKLKEMNSDAERTMSMGLPYSPVFQRRYASLIVELESLNMSLERYLTVVQNFCQERAPEVSTAAMLAPSYLREKSLSEAKAMIDKYFEEKEELKNEKLTQLVTELVALMIQVQTLSETKHSAHELQILKQSMARIKTIISPTNLLVFQNSVEVHIQYIESSLSQKDSLSALIANPPSPS